MYALLKKYRAVFINSYDIQNTRKRYLSLFPKGVYNSVEMYEMLNCWTGFRLFTKYEMKT